jgi:hypothetical protein
MRGSHAGHPSSGGGTSVWHEMVAAFMEEDRFVAADDNSGVPLNCKGGRGGEGMVQFLKVMRRWSSSVRRGSGSVFVESGVNGTPVAGDGGRNSKATEECAGYSGGAVLFPEKERAAKASPVFMAAVGSTSQRRKLGVGLGCSQVGGGGGWLACGGGGGGGSANRL